MRDWLIHITCHNRPVGKPIRVKGWEVLTKLALIRAILPGDWEAEAYPVIKPYPTWEC